MLGTLRFPLTALFLAVVLVFGLVSIAAAVRLFQDVTRAASERELERKATGLAALYAESALRSTDEGAKAPEFAAEKLELATGDELFYVGASLFPGQRFGLTRLPRSALGEVELDRDRQLEVDDSALFRHPEMPKDTLARIDHPIERAAKEIGVSYVDLDGDIAIISSGAGLGMATMDVVGQRLKPANFLETGGGITEE